MNDGIFHIVPVRDALKQNEFYSHLYLHHTDRGKNRNQSGIADPNLHNSFGSTVVNDWPLYDGLGPNAKVIARAQGLHIQAGMKTKSWYNSFSIVFEDARYKGSSLQVVGPVVERGEWAIVGGTGQFSLANGVIYKKFHEQKKDGNIMELDIHAFYSAVVRPWTIEGNIGHFGSESIVPERNRMVLIGCLTELCAKLKFQPKRPNSS